MATRQQHVRAFLAEADDAQHVTTARRVRGLILGYGRESRTRLLWSDFPAVRLYPLLGVLSAARLGHRRI